jgi:hypothetical protein
VLVLVLVLSDQSLNEKPETGPTSLIRSPKILAIGIIHAGQRARLEQIDLIWNHEAHGSFIRGERTDVSLLFDSCSRRWTLRIYKRQTSFGQPVTYEIAFKERYGPTVEQAIALANDILVVELENSPITSHPPHL